MCLKKNVVEYGQKLCLGCLWLCDFAADFTTTAHEAQKDKCCVTWFLAIYLYQTSMEDDLNGAQPQWKTTSIEADLNRRWPPYKITLMEDNLNGRLSKWKNNLYGEWPQWKLTLRKPYRRQMTLTCLASQFCTELGPAQPQLVIFYF